MKWKKLVHKANARHYAWPSGWDPAEVIAEQLECSAERVREHLAPSIRAGEVEVKQFTIWDSETERKVVKTGYRIAGAKAQAPALKSQAEAIKSQNRQKTVDSAISSPVRWPFHEGAKIKRIDSARIGVVKSGRIHWEDGKVNIPSRSTAHKLRLAGKK
jgi:hypothetical protein